MSRYLAETFTILVLTCISITGCKTTEDLSGRDTNNPSGRVVESIREQIEQTEEVRDASGTIQSNLESIDGEANSILDGIAQSPNQKDNVGGRKGKFRRMDPGYFSKDPLS